MNLTAASSLSSTALNAYSPDQPRDSDGKWGSGGGSSVKTTPEQDSVINKLQEAGCKCPDRTPDPANGAVKLNKDGVNVSVMPDGSFSVKSWRSNNYGVMKGKGPGDVASLSKAGELDTYSEHQSRMVDKGILQPATKDERVRQMVRKATQRHYPSEFITLDDREGVAARAFSPRMRKLAVRRGASLPDGSFPIFTKADLSNAITLVGRAKDYAKAKAHIMQRAKALGATSMLPKMWTSK